MARPWVKLHRSMYEPDSTVADVAEDAGGMVYAYWPAFSVWASNEDTPGAFKSTVRGMRRALHDRVSSLDDVKKIVRTLHGVGLIDAMCDDPELDGDVWVTIPKFADWQVLSRADQKAIERSRAVLQSGSDDSDTVRPEATRSDIPSRGETVDRREEERDMSDQPDAKPAPSPVDPDRDPIRANVQLVFEAWKKAFGKTERTLLDPKRRARIVWAIKTYGMAAVGDCLRGYRSDPWDGRAKNCDLTLLFRDAAHFEAGLELHAGPGDGPDDVNERLRRAGY